MAEFDFEKFGKDVLDSVGNAAETVASAAQGATGDVVRYKHFNETGRDLFLSGAVTSHGGNLSQSDGNSIWISRKGAMLGRMTPGDVRKTGWKPSPDDEGCSRELVVHRAIYHALSRAQSVAGQPFTHKAIVHAHTVHTIFRSMIDDAIVPLDSEGLYTLGGPIQVFAPEITIASEEAAALLAVAFEGGARIAVLRKHGPFAVGDTLEEAFQLISCLEQSAKILDLHEMTGHKG